MALIEFTAGTHWWEEGLEWDSGLSWSGHTRTGISATLSILIEFNATLAAQTAVAGTMSKGVELQADALAAVTDITAPMSKAVAMNAGPLATLTSLSAMMSMAGEWSAHLQIATGIAAPLDKLIAFQPDSLDVLTQMASPSMAKGIAFTSDELVTLTALASPDLRKAIALGADPLAITTVLAATMSGGEAAQFSALLQVTTSISATLQSMRGAWEQHLEDLNDLVLEEFKEDAPLQYQPAQGTAFGFDGIWHNNWNPEGIGGLAIVSETAPVVWIDVDLLPATSIQNRGEGDRVLHEGVTRRVRDVEVISGLARIELHRT